MSKQIITVSEKMGTKYIINSLVGTFTNILSRAAENDDLVDLSDCKLGPEAAGALRSYYGRVAMINSADSILDQLLKDNTQTVLEGQYDPYPPVKFPDKLNLQTFGDWLTSISEGAKIGLPFIEESRQDMIAFIVLAIMMRPDIEFDIHECAYVLYMFVSDGWKLRAQTHDKYIQFMRPDWHIVECVDGVIDTPYTGCITESLFVDKYDVLPYDFGTKMLLEQDANGNPSGEWANVIMKCMTTLTVTGKAKVNHLYNYLKARRP